MTSFNPEPVVGQSPIERALSDLQRKTALIERNMNIDTGWIDATLVNGWTDLGVRGHQPHSDVRMVSRIFVA